MDSLNASSRMTWGAVRSSALSAFRTRTVMVCPSDERSVVLKASSPREGRNSMPTTRQATTLRRMASNSFRVDSAFTRSFSSNSWQCSFRKARYATCENSQQRAPGRIRRTESPMEKSAALTR